MGKASDAWESDGEQGERHEDDHRAKVLQEHQPNV
jgi:hypothetical protein